MNRRLRPGIAAALGAALAVALGTAPFDARADTRSDYHILCLDFSESDPGIVTYPMSTNDSAGTYPVTAGGK